MSKEKIKLEPQEIIIENEKLMKKSFRMIISFFTFFSIGFVLFLFLQYNKFFIFNVNRSFNNVTSPLISEFFSAVFLIIIFLGIITYVIFALQLLRRREMKLQEQIDTYERFEKIHNVADIFSIVPLFLVIVMVINGFFYSFATVDGISMQPTFCDNDAVIIKYVDEYHKEDIVILEQNDIYLIKRLVAVPGDKLTVNASGVYVNDVLIETTIGSYYIHYEDLIIPEGYYYVMGDNRDHSEDSRMFGLKDESRMLGKVVYRISTSTCPIE